MSTQTQKINAQGYINDTINKICAGAYKCPSETKEIILRSVRHLMSEAELGYLIGENKKLKAQLGVAQKAMVNGRQLVHADPEGAYWLLENALTEIEFVNNEA